MLMSVKYNSTYNYYFINANSEANQEERREKKNQQKLSDDFYFSGKNRERTATDENKNIDIKKTNSVHKTDFEEEQSYSIHTYVGNHINVEA